MSDTIRWPAAIYLDANILRKLPHDLSSPELVKLQSLARESKIGLFVPELAVDEWVLHHERAVQKKYETISSAARTIGKYLQREPLKFEEIGLETMSKEVGENQRDYLLKAKLTVIPTPEIDVKEFIRMAVRGERPFEEGDKGFRDTVIAFTIADHAKAFEGHYILVVSDDHVFENPNVLGLWRKSGVEPLVAKTLDDATLMVDNVISDAVKSYYNQESSNIREFLVTQQDPVFKYLLKNAEISESFVKGRFLGPGDFNGTLEAVTEVRPLEVMKAFKGSATQSANSEEGRVPITFTVKVALDITVSDFDADAFAGPRFPLGEAVNLRGRTFGPLLFARRVERDTTIEREIVVEASVLQSQQGEYSDLRIEKILTY